MGRNEEFHAARLPPEVSAAEADQWESEDYAGRVGEVTRETLWDNFRTNPEGVYDLDYRGSEDPDDHIYGVKTDLELGRSKPITAAWNQGDPSLVDGHHRVIAARETGHRLRVKWEAGT